MRSYKLDMGYESMWGLLDDLSQKEILDEIDLLSSKNYYSDLEKAKDKYSLFLRKIKVLKKIIKDREATEATVEGLPRKLTLAVKNGKVSMSTINRIIKEVTTL